MQPSLYLSILALLVVACGDGGVLPDPDNPVDPPGGLVDASEADAVVINIDAPSPGDGGTAVDAIIFCNSARRLYQFDPQTLITAEVGSFDIGGTAINDIAINRFGDIAAVSLGKLWSVDGETGQATFEADLQRGFNALTYMSINDGASERLLGTTSDGDIYAIDESTGLDVFLGSYGGGLRSSGDILYVEGFGLFATAQYNTGTDRLLRIDVEDFSVNIVGDIGVRDVYGLAFWGDNTLYGFVRDKEIRAINPDTAASVLASVEPVVWAGAGITTVSAVID